jgi:predicted small metal-binding protein
LVFSAFSLSSIVSNCAFCAAAESVGELGQLMLKTVAIHAARKSRVCSAPVK